MIFHGDHKPIRKEVLQDAKISEDIQEKLNCLLHIFKDISSSSNGIGHTKLIEMNIETDPNLWCIASKPYTIPFKYQEWVRKEIDDLGKARIIQRRLFSYVSPIIIVPRKCPSGSPVQEPKSLCIEYKKLNTQLPTVHGNKSSR